MSRRTPWWRVLALLLALSMSLAAACSGGDDDGSDDASGSDDTEQDEGAAPAQATTTEPQEEPPGTQPAEVRPYIEELLRRFDEVTAEIMADPHIARNRDHSLYAELRDLLTPDSEYAEPVITALMEQGLEGMSQRPYGDAGPPIQREILGDITGVSEDEVTFQVCAVPYYRLYNGSGQQIQISTGPNLLGDGAASRVDGRWLIDTFNSLGDNETCTEGSQ